MKKYKVSQLIKYRSQLLMIARSGAISQKASLSVLAASGKFHEAIPSDMRDDLESQATKQSQLYISISNRLATENDKAKVKKTAEELRTLALDEFNKSAELEASQKAQQLIRDYEVEFELKPVHVNERDLIEFPEKTTVFYLGMSYSQSPEPVFFQLVEDCVITYAPEPQPA